MKFKKMAAFSLLEMAIALSILGLLLVVALPMISNHYAGQLAATQKSIVKTSFSKMDNALITFAKQQFRLPCPDSDDDGLENCTVSNGLLPYRTLGFNTPLVDGYQRKIRYSVYTQPANDLNLAETTLTDRYERVLPISAVPSVNYNDLDFCQALRLAQTQSFSSTYTHGTDSGVTTHAAYILASSGAADANHNATDGLYDGLNENGGNRFGSTDNVVNAIYDDYVHALSFSEFSGRLGCGAITSAVTSAANLAINAWAQSEIADDGLDTADFNVTVAKFNLTMARIDIVLAGINTALAITHGLLAVAMSTSTDPTSPAAILGFKLETAAGVIELATAIAAVVKAANNVTFTKESRQAAKKTKDAAILTEIDIVTKAMMADLRGGTTR